MMASVKNVIMIMLNDRASKKFALGVLLGFAFSISCILGTIGIMDGFDEALRTGLKKSTGDIIIYNRDGFFNFEGDIEDIFKREQIGQFSTQIQTEGFLIHEKGSQGIGIKGIEEESFNSVAKITMNLKEGEIVLGSELAKKFNLQIGDEIALALANGNREFSDLPKLERLKVSDIVTHGVYEKDLRITYLRLFDLQKLMAAENKINTIAFNIPSSFMKIGSDSKSYSKRVKEFARKVNLDLPYGFDIRTYWRDYSSLLEAVKVEKFIIGLILQLVVVISIFNVLAFVIFLNEKKSKEIFLFRALGMENKEIFRSWIIMSLFIWVGASSLSIIFVEIFDLALKYLLIFKLPGEIYHMGRLHIVLSFTDYAIVFLLALVWLLGISLFGLRKIKKRSVLYGLRKEFA